MSQRTADELEHRRGMVLGLTLAEVLLLLLFVLILALGGRLLALQRMLVGEQEKSQALAIQVKRLDSTLEPLSSLLAALKAKRGLDTSSIEELAIKLSRMDAVEADNDKLKASNSQLTNIVGSMRLIGSDLAKIKAINDAIATAAKINPNDPPEVLTRALEILKRLGTDVKPTQVNSLTELNNDSEKIKALRGVISAATRINPSNPPEAAARALAILARLGPETQPEEVMSVDQQSLLAGQLDRTRQERDNLIHRGNGLTYPSCWLTPSGQTEYMFDVTIQDNGLILRDATPTRANDPAMQLVSGVPRNTLIPENAFKNGTTELFKFSQKQNCRFYSIIRDQTAPTSKQRYKELRTLVESHFYPLLRSDAWAGSRPADASQVGGEYVPIRPQR